MLNKRADGDDGDDLMPGAHFADPDAVNEGRQPESTTDNHRLVAVNNMLEDTPHGQAWVPEVLDCDIGVSGKEHDTTIPAIQDLIPDVMDIEDGHDTTKQDVMPVFDMEDERDIDIQEVMLNTMTRHDASIENGRHVAIQDLLQYELDSKAGVVENYTLEMKPIRVSRRANKGKNARYD